MRPGVWSLTDLHSQPRRDAPQPAARETPLEPLVPGAWAAWARRGAVEAEPSAETTTPVHGFRRPAFHTTRS